MINLNKILLLTLGICLSSCGKGLNPKSSNTNNGGGGNTVTYKKIYLAAKLYNTGDGGVEDFDNSCSPGYKALVGHSTSRHPNIAGSGATGWVLAANTEYRRQDGVIVIGTTNTNAVFDFPLTNSFGSAAGKYYTGLQTNWTVDITYNCSNWGSMGDDRTYGDALSTNANAISENHHNCGTGGVPNSVICVEQ